MGSGVCVCGCVCGVWGCVRVCACTVANVCTSSTVGLYLCSVLTGSVS